MQVPPNPTIKITFDGLLVFTFDQAKQLCEVGVLKAQDHVLRINRVTTDASGKKHAHPEIAAEIQSGDIFMEIPERNGHGGVSRFNALEGEDDSQDFRWVVDIEKLHNNLHPDGLLLRDGFPQQSIFIRQGVFHTAKRIPVSLVQPDGTKQEIKIASPVGCNLYMKAEKFVLSYGLAGKKLEITAEAGTTHEITILNTPKEHSPGGAHSAAGDDQFKHFDFFYASALEVRPGEEFKIEPSNNRLGLTGAGTPDRPCPPILLGKRTEGLTTAPRNVGQN